MLREIVTDNEAATLRNQRYGEPGVEKLWGEAPYLELRPTGEVWLQEAVRRYRRMRL